MRKFIAAIIALILVLTLPGCSSKKVDEQTESEDDPLAVMFGWNAWIYEMDSADSNLRNPVNTPLFEKIKASMEDESGAVFDMVKLVLSDKATFDFLNDSGWSGKCYVSDVVIPTYAMHNNKLSGVYSLLAFSDNSPLVLELSVYESYTSFENIGGYYWNINVLNDNTLSFFKQAPDEKYIFVNNGGYLMLDTSNGIHITKQYAEGEYSITGDFYHALDYEALAVSYNEITSPEHLHEIEIVENN